eukprot:TRINITY_DN11064_c0_g1_i1.p1 TRINITY_DN11064_c0_g1~~TRINITY_DN11064_c0_g1_i1.p1  ORF type:complete len:307 (-),score=117.14 TRINITY_DN11064_c0_g1_i1:104-1024(-)
MSTPAKKDNNITEESGSGAVDVFLHALVVINISDHFTRERVNNPKTAKHRIFGALLGQQTGRIVHVYNSFELICTDVNGQLIIDTEYLKTKKEQFRKVFPDLEFLGWYSTGKEAQVSDLDIHKQLMEYNESPLFLLLDPVPSAEKRELPIVVYETELKVIKDEPTLRFAKVQYKIETGEAERIAVDHVARVGSAGSQSMLTSHLSSMHNAIKMLNIRIKSIVTYLEAVKAGKLPADQSVLRRLSSLVNLLPAIESANFNNEFLSEYNDALLVTYLASITKTSNSMNEMIDKFNITFDRHTRRRGFY